jgi:hypothetical protein
MKISILIILVLLSNFLYGQHVDVSFAVKYDQSSFNYKLTINDTVTVWKDITDEAINKKDKFFIKNIRRKLIYYSDFIFNKSFYVNDSLHTMQWELTNDTKVILEEKCSSAKTNFRGRKYTAYYSNNFSVSDGPWKFGGLPGLILEVKSEDDLYQFVATKIVKNTNSQLNIVDINTHKFVPWATFIEKFISVVDNTIKMIKTDQTTIENNTKGFLKIGAPEIIYPKLQVGEGIEF